MTIVPKIKFTPEVLIEAPRRSPAIPNAAGTHALFAVSTYSLDSHSESKEVRILDISDGSSRLFSNNPTEQPPQWLGDEDDVLWLRVNDGGETQVWIGSTLGEKNAYLAGTVPSSIGNVQTCSLGPDAIGLAFSAPTTSKGELLNPKQAPKQHHTAREFSSHPVRFWDTWMQAERNSLYYTVLSRTDAPNKKWKLGDRYVNALKGTRLQFPCLPSGFIDEGGSYAMSPAGILLSTLDPGQNYARCVNYGTYHIPLETFQEQPKPKRIEVPDYTGSQYAPAFSPDGRLAAVLVTKDKESGLGAPVGVAVLKFDEPTTTNLLVPEEGPNRTWDRRPDGLLWGHDSRTLYLVAEDLGHSRLFALDLDLEGPAVRTLPVPQRLTTDGSVASASLLDRRSKSAKTLLVSMTGILESSLFAVVDASSRSVSAISSATNQGKLFGLKKEQVSEITFRGAGDYDVQAWIVRPSDFDENKKYPVALLIHGGPMSAWRDAWSTRWNHGIFAEQGYVVVAPNPTGSTGFGDEFMNAVNADWGGRPYEDIVRCFEHVEEHLGYVDASNAVALGASYGGYMVNWIAGQPLAKKLRALVSHDGIFNLHSDLAADYIAYMDLELGGAQWEKKEEWERWSPSSYTANWTTPMLIVHSDKDFRCPLSEGLAAYGVLRAKGIESRLLNFPDENHFVLGRENSLKWNRTVLGWINRYTGVKGGVVLEDACSEPRFEE